MIGLVDGNNFFVSCERVFNRRLVGRPVAVLSNNDGCCVARSNEFKALGIAMGTPYFRLRDRERTGELVFLSSNFELYGDMSMRMISVLKDEAVDVEQYSIDEAFIYPPTTAAGDYVSYGERVRAKILRWIGLPCGVGFAPTKTLAKIANHIAKKSPRGVYLLPEDPTEILSSLPCGEVWGVGSRLAPKLRSERILTALHLRDADDGTLRSLGGVTLLRTSMELRGVPCLDERGYDAPPDSISCSRSFGEPATSKDVIRESLAAFASQAAAKMRKHALLAEGCNIYAQIFASGGGGECTGRTILFPSPTDATNEILRSISPHVDSLYLSGLRYRKTGIVFFGLQSQDTPRQIDFFDGGLKPDPVRSRLYQAVDALNERYGRGKVFSASEGIGKKSWHMKRDKLSGRSTTRWDEIVRVK